MIQGFTENYLNNRYICAKSVTDKGGQKTTMKRVKEGGRKELPVQYAAVGMLQSVNKV